MENNMKIKILVFGIVLLFVGASIVVQNHKWEIVKSISIVSVNASAEPLGEMVAHHNYSHTVFVGIGTSQNCEPCHSWNQHIHEVYLSEEYNFEYVEMIEYDHEGFVLNQKAHEWAENYSIGAYPTSIFDGDFQRIIGDIPGKLPIVLNESGIREVANITANITLTWLGNATIQVNITIKNNEETQYNGHIRAFITEIVSRYDTKEGDPYYFGFLDYAFNKNIQINSGEEYVNSTVWNGNDHEDEHGNNFGDIIANNIQVTMAVYNNSNSYVDETVAARMSVNTQPYAPHDPIPSDGDTDVGVDIDLSWKGGDPDGDNVTYDVYFGNSSSPEKVSWNQSEVEYDPGILDFETTYYWRVVAWDEYGASTEGTLWHFTTTPSIELEVKITEPTEESFYFRNIRLFTVPFGTIVYGPIDIKVNATSSVGINNVEFYIDDELEESDSEKPYIFSWAPLLCSSYTIKVVATDNNGNQEQDEITVLKWRVHPILILASILLLIKIVI
jgi:hypothetical protein